MKWVASAIVAALAAFGFYREVVPPTICNIRTLQITRSTSEAAHLPVPRRTIAAENNLPALEECLPHTPELTQAYVTAAVNAAWAGQPDKARGLLTRALQVDQRPEIYMQLGILEMQQVDTVPMGMEHMELACRFANNYVARIPYADARDEINGRVYRREMGIRARATRRSP